MGLWLGCAFLFATLSAEPAVRPNILWVVTEDNSPEFVGSYGSPLARTPVFDRLAREGIVFDRAYAAAPVCAPSRASLITGMYAPSLGTQHMRSQVALPEWVRYFPAYLREAGYYTTNRSKTDYNAAVLPGTWDQLGENAHWRNRRPGQPFFSVFNFAASHEGRLHQRRPLRTDPGQVRVPAYLPDTPETRADLAQYFDCVAEADRQIGEIISQLEADGLLEHTIIFYYSDHGGVLPRSKRFLYESGTRVPLMVRFPAHFRELAPQDGGTRNSDLVSLVDFPPTLLSLAGVPAPSHLQGRAFAGPQAVPAPAVVHQFRDRMDERYDLSRAVTDGRWRYIRNYRPELPAGQRLEYLWRMASAARLAELWQNGELNEAQAAFFRPRAVEELYDLTADPDNVRNLAGDPAARPHLLRLRAANRAHLLATHDLGFVPEALLRDATRATTPADFARQARLYPLERILTLIDEAQLGLAAEPRVPNALHDESPIMRYWAARTTKPAANPAEVETLLSDPVPSVRIAAADVRLARGDSRAAWQILAEILTGAFSNETRLEAANVIANRPQWPESIRTALASAAAADSATEPGVGSLCRFLLAK